MPVCLWWGSGVSGHHGAMTAARKPSDWLEDMTWHRRMYDQSKFRWVPEDPMSIALTWTKGRVEFTTPGHLRRLDIQLHELRYYAGGIQDAMLDPLALARERCPDYRAGLELVGMTKTDVDILRYNALSGRVRNHPEARRALRGIPLPNPFSQVWELRQMHGMYAAADNILEDTFCDLATELAEDLGWDSIAPLTVIHRTGNGVRLRVEQQRRERGLPGDPRRRVEQRY